LSHKHAQSPFIVKKIGTKTSDPNQRKSQVKIIMRTLNDHRKTLVSPFMSVTTQLFIYSRTERF